MKKLSIFLLLVSCFIYISSAQPREYRLVPIDSLQFVPADSLAAADNYTTIPTSGIDPLWTKQVSNLSSARLGRNDTVEIVGIVVVPPKVISYTGIGSTSGSVGNLLGGAKGAYNILLRDTAQGGGPWKYVFVRAGTHTTTTDLINAADTLALYNEGFPLLQRGDIIRLRGYVSEFPTGTLVSGTQFVPLASTFIASSTMSTCVEYIGRTEPPAPINMEALTFYNGSYPTGKVKFTTGEPYEGAFVQFTNLKVSALINSTNGTFSMQDSYNNEIGMMDASIWFTLRNTFKSPTSSYAAPSVGQIIDTIRGYIMTNSGSEAPRGFRIAPCFKGDIVFGNVVPGVSTHRRNPVVLTSNDTATISIKAYKQTGGSVIKKVTLRYSVNNGVWIDSVMKGSSTDSVYTSRIPKQAVGTFIKYYCTVTDSINPPTIYANAAAGSAWQDTTQGFFFYTVKDEPLTIADIQYTPFANGMTGYLGAVVTLNGVVTADTGNLSLFASGTTPWYIQNGNAPWSGIWLAGTDVMFTGIKVGDSISVTGTVQEDLDGVTGHVGRVTRLGNITAANVISSGNPVPEPLLKTTSDFNANNGAISAEPYEGMLVRFNNVSITQRFPTFSDSTEFVIDDGSGPIVARSEDGRNIYSNWKIDPVKGKLVLLQSGGNLSYIQGIIYFSYNAYKLVPRGDSDFGTYTPPTSVELKDSGIPSRFSLYQNYPNPFNPNTTIAFDIPVSGIVTLKVYNILGREITTLVNDYRAAGHYTAKFEASKFPSGVYFCRLQSASGVMTKKMLLLK